MLVKYYKKSIPIFLKVKNFCLKNDTSMQRIECRLQICYIIRNAIFLKIKFYSVCFNDLNLNNICKNIS